MAAMMKVLRYLQQTASHDLSRGRGGRQRSSYCRCLRTSCAGLVPVFSLVVCCKVSFGALPSAGSAQCHQCAALWGTRRCEVLSVCPPIPCRPPDVTTASHTASGTRSCQPLPALPANTSPRVQDKTHKAYTAMSRLLLVVASVLLACGSWASALPFDGAVPWNLELEPLTSSSYFRMRRQAAFPESLTSCVTITFLTDMKHRFESLIDTNHDGRATAEEMEAYLRKFKPSVTDEEVAAFIRRRDIDGFVVPWGYFLFEDDDGIFLSLHESQRRQMIDDELAVEGIEWKVSTIAVEDKHAWDSVIDFIPEYVLDISSPDMSPEAAREWFMLEDRNGDSYVAKSELLTIAENLGMSPDQAEDSVSSYYMSADANKDEQLSFQEYKSLYGQRR